jgi:hypothetical protein
MEIKFNQNSPIYKIPLSDVTNLSNYLNERNYIECALCKYLAINPSFCENCKSSFCEKCIQELNVNNCPSCSLQNQGLNVTNDKFYEFFKNMMVKCTACNEEISYPNLASHRCFIESKPHDLESHIRNPGLQGTSQDSQSVDIFRLFNGNIQRKCPKCNEWVNATSMNNHIISCPSNSGVSVINPTNFPVNPAPYMCEYCYKTINQSEQVSHLKECPEFIKKVIEQEKTKSFSNVSPPTSQPSTNVVELIENLKKATTSLDTSNVSLLISTMSSLEKAILNFEQNANPSFCRSCKSVKKNYELNICKCCAKKYCSTCCIPCLNCEEIISKNCQFTCQNCKQLKCSLCEIQTGTFCLCLDHKFCKTCFNNPNANNISIAMLKGAHVNCSYVKLLENNIYVLKFLKFNFRCEISLNSIKQTISLSLIKNGQEVFSKLFSVNINDKLIVQREGTSIKVGSGFDYWSVDAQNVEGGFDYMIINFNMNPNYAYVLNKLNTTNFDQLTTTTGGTGMLGMFSIKNLISNILVTKI